MKLFFIFSVKNSKMKKNDICKQIDTYLDGELSEEETKQFESHLESCEECMQLKETLVSAWSALDLWEDKESPSDLRANILNTIRHEEKRRKQVFLLRYLLPVAAMIAIVFTLFFSTFDTIDNRAKYPVKTVKHSLDKQTLTADSSSLPDEEFFEDLSEEEVEFFENLDIISNIEYLYLIDSEEQRLLNDKSSYYNNNIYSSRRDRLCRTWTGEKGVFS
jgi:hypothetical protein